MTAAGRVSTWIRGRSPAPPPQLLARIDEIVADGGRPDAALPDALLDMAETAMANALRGGCLTRDRALDLLAVDALVTYAFEAAADDADRLDDRTQRALPRLAALARAYPD